MSNLLIVVFCWLFFGALHSSLIYMPLRKNLQEIFNIDDQSYRLFYALISIISLFICALTTLLLHGRWLFNPDFITYIGGGILILGSLYLMKLSFKNYSLTIFIGLQPENNAKLKITGLNRYVRHPLYLSTVLFLLGIIVFWPSNLIIASCLILIGYTLLGARLEERKLINQFGKEYTDYIKEVPAFIPKLRDI